MPPPIRRSEHGVLIDVLVVPNASRSELVGLLGSRVKVRVASPPEKLKANATLIALMRSVFGVRKVHITSGRTTRFKTVELIGADLEAVVRTVGER
jgi:hypothetical protein